MVPTPVSSSACGHRSTFPVQLQRHCRFQRPTTRVPIIAAAVSSSTSTPLHEQYMSAEAARAAASLEVLPHQSAPLSSSSTAAAVDNRPAVLNMSGHRALVLDSSYRPIEVVSWQKAICMDLFDKVDVLEYYDDILVHSAYDQFLLPAVLRVRMFLGKKSGKSRVAINRRNIFLRDNNQCQYCGSRDQLTIDHVLPLSKGGDWSWGNLVAACHACNSKKGARTLKQLGWSLRKQPTEPNPYDVGIVLGQSLGDALNHPKEWAAYLEPYEQQGGKKRRT